MNYVAFDLGGSGGKVMLGRFDGKNLNIENIHRFENSPHLINGGLYWDIINIYREMNLGLKKAVFRADDNIGSFGIDSFSNDFAFIDKSGELLTPVRCYRDIRTERYKSQIYSKMPPERLYKLTGNQIASFNTLMQLAAMIESGQGHILENAHKLLFTPDLIINFLTGETISEYTISSVSQMYNFELDNWCDEILQTFGIPKKLFGQLVKPSTIVGSTKKDYNDFIGTKGFQVVSVCEHDTASAFLASLHKGDCAIISSGTWSIVGTEILNPNINSFGFEHNIANEGGFSKHHRLLINVMGTWLLQQLRSSFKDQGKDLSYSQMIELGASSKPFEYFIDVDDSVFFSPGNIENKIRSKCIINYGKSPETVGQLVRCVCESLALKYRWAIEKLERLIEKPLPVISIIGGGSKDEFTSQLTANICGKPVVAGPPDATALGNILVQLIAKGEISNIDEGKEMLRKSIVVKEYIPNDTEIWDEKYFEFKTMFKLK